LGRSWRARAQGRAREFGARHPGLAGVTVCAIPLGAVALAGLQLSYGLYLGRGWVIAALAGVATGAGVNAWAMLSLRRTGGELDFAVTTWLVLWLVSASTAIRLPFPRGPYGGVQAVFNVVHAALLGYEAVTFAAIVAVPCYLLVRYRGRARSRAVPAVPAGPVPGRARRTPGRDGLPARLRSPGATAATWRAGRLIAADGTVRWRSRTRDAEFDLTEACQDPAMLSAAVQARQPRTTTLTTPSGLVEVDVSPRALASLARSLHHPSQDETARPLAQD
jgi:hypothetical protein